MQTHSFVEENDETVSAIGTAARVAGASKPVDDSPPPPPTGGLEREAGVRDGGAVKSDVVLRPELRLRLGGRPAVARKPLGGVRLDAGSEEGGGGAVESVEIWLMKKIDHKLCSNNISRTFEYQINGET